jgi:transcriptional regulator
VVPTWDYATVHAWGKPVAIEDAIWLHRHIGDLTKAQELKRVPPWAVSDAPGSFIDALLENIVGVEIAITRIEGKWKMSQNREDGDRAGVIAGMNAEGDPHQNQPLAALVAKYLQEGSGK